MSVAPEQRGVVVPHPAGHRGTLRTATGDELPVQTYDSGPEVVLVVLSEIGEPPPAEALDPATLEYTSLRGVVRLQGGAQFADRSLVHFRADGDPEVIQRRAFVRVHTSRALTLHMTTGSPGVHTVDLSGGGMLLFGAAHLGPGDLIGFEMSLEEGEAPITGTARVVRIDADGRRGLQFERIAEEDRQRLIRLVFACMRTARAKTRGDLV